MIAMEREEWEKYQRTELLTIEPLFKELGYTLDTTQVHLGGERYLAMGSRDVGGGGKKFVLTGTRDSDTVPVIIKVSSDPAGMQEIMRERECRHTLRSLNFAVWAFNMPEELYFSKGPPYCISIIEYIPQDKGFLELSLRDQFFLSLKALETQEGVHATTSEHAAAIGRTFGLVSAEDYLASFDAFCKKIKEAGGAPELQELCARAQEELEAHEHAIERYCGFLTHADFVPNNLRIKDQKVYLLDYASLHFGNKYESWARFINFMVHHAPALEHTLVEYVRKNRGEEEYQSLRLMRIYKLGFLLAFYTEALGKTRGDLQALTDARLAFWQSVMRAVLEDTFVPSHTIQTFLETSERLRTPEEKARQRELVGTPTTA